jgi:hypothetical protein
MTRPRKQIVDYFPHDTDASQGRTLSVLQNKYGNDGYAFWFQLLELLGRSPGHFYNFKEVTDWEFLLARTHISRPETARSILETLATMNAIDLELYEQGIIWSQNFVDRLADVYVRRKENKPGKPVSAAETPISSAEMPVSTISNPQSKVNKSKLLPLKGDSAKCSPPSKEKKDSIVNEIFAEMRTYLGFPDKVKIDPIPSYGKEGQAIKRMLTRGFTREEILACWKSKVSQRGGEFVSMAWVNQDIGTTGTGKQKQGSREPSTEAEIAASIKGLV